MPKSKLHKSEVGAPPFEVKEPKAVLDLEMSLDDLLASGEQILIAEVQNAQLAAMTKAEVDAMIRRQHEAIIVVIEAEGMLEKELKHIEDENPFMNGSVGENDLDRLHTEGVISEKLSGQLKGIFKMLNDLAKVENPSSAALAHHQKVVLTLQGITQQIEQVISVKQGEIRARRDLLKDEALAASKDKNEKMQAIVEEVMANPRVIDRLREMTEERSLLEAKAEAEQTEIILKEAGMAIQSLSARHRNAFDRLRAVTKNLDIAYDLASAQLSKDDPKSVKAFSDTRRVLKVAILEKEGDEQIKNPSEVVPWENKTSVDYREAIDFLKSKLTIDTLRQQTDIGNAKAQKLVELRSVLVVENELLRTLFGPKWSFDNKTKERYPGPFWNLFDERKNQASVRAQQEARTKAERSAQEARVKSEAAAQEKKRVDFMESAKGILSRGGFLVEAPVYQSGREGSRLVGKELGVVRLEEAIGAKSIKVWKVAEVFGHTGDVKVGRTDDLTLVSVPYWLREAAKEVYLMDGPKFVKRKDQVE